MSAYLAVLLLQPIAIRAADNAFNPFGIIQVPLHGFFNPTIKGLFGFPAKVTLYLAGIDCVAAIVAGPVFYKADLLCIGFAIRSALGFSSSKMLHMVFTTSILAFSFQPPML